MSKLTILIQENQLDVNYYLFAANFKTGLPAESFAHNGKWSRVNKVRSSEHDLTRAVFIFREHETLSL